jgi:hypothetical protein
MRLTPARSRPLGEDAMDSIEGKSLDEPDERREFSNGIAEMVTIGDVMIGRAVFQPGWRWSNDVKPIAGTDLCMILHQGYVVQGSLGVQAEDGTEKTLNPGEAYVIQPGHDAWVVGDERYIGIDFSPQMAEYAKPRS